MDLQYEKRLTNALVELASQRLLKSAHDVSLGGLAIALAKCCLNETKPIGAKVVLPQNLRTDFLLFGETQGIAIVTIEPRKVGSAQRLLDKWKIPYLQIGTVGGNYLTIRTNKAKISLGIKEMIEAYYCLNLRYDPHMKSHL